MLTNQVQTNILPDNGCKFQFAVVHCETNEAEKLIMFKFISCKKGNLTSNSKD